MAAGGYLLPPPTALEIHDVKASERWRRFKEQLLYCHDIETKDEPVQVATLLIVIGEEARQVYSTFTWDAEGDSNGINKVLEKFLAYCEPRKNIHVPFERYKFNLRTQETIEAYDHYRRL